MRTKLATVALATLLTAGGAAVALAQPADTIAAHRAHQQEMAKTIQPSSDGTTQYDTFASAPQTRTQDSSVASARPSPRPEPQARAVTLGSDAAR